MQHAAVQSYVVGASLFTRDRATHMAALTFYQSLFQEKEANISNPWERRVVVSPDSSRLPSNDNHSRPSEWLLHIVDTNCQGKDDVFTPHLFQHPYARHEQFVYEEERIRFVHVRSESLAEVNSPPYTSHQREDGAVVWANLLTPDREELTAASATARLFGWRHTVPISFPLSPYTFLTALHHSGRTANRYKVCGILARSALLAGDDERSRFCEWLVSFGCRSSERLIQIRERIEPLGGKVVSPYIEADGVVCVARDPQGTPFALYYRTDVWEETKPNTVLYEGADITKWKKES